MMKRKDWFRALCRALAAGSLVVLFGAAGAFDAADKLTLPLCLLPFGAAAAFGLFAELGGLTYRRDKP